MLPQGFVQELLGRVDVVEVVGRQVELKRAGTLHKGLCPFHGEKTPSFTVSPTRQTYHCFGCGAHGDAIRFLMETQGLGFMDAVRDLAQRVGVSVPEDDASPQERERAAQRKKQQATLGELLERAAQHYRRTLKDSPAAIDYLKKRGLSGEIAVRFAIGYAPPGWRNLASVFGQYDDPALVEAGLVIVQGDDEQQKRYDRFRDRIMFPIRSVRGEVIGFGGRVLDGGEPKYLNSPETPLFVKGRELYGLFEARAALREAGHALVVEGYMDVVALAQAGLGHAVATLGTACTAEHVAKLFRFTDQVVFSFDGDAAGRRAAARALEAALPHASDHRSVRFLFLPPEHDPDSFVREHGRDAFAQAVADAVPLSRQLLEQAAADCDLATAEGRARMLSQAKPLWQALPEGALRAQLLTDLAQQGRLAEHDLARLWGERHGPGSAGATGGPMAGAGRARARPRPPGAALRDTALGPRNNIVAALLAASHLWATLAADARDTLLALDGWHGEAIRWLERQLENHGAEPWPALRSDLARDASCAEWAERATALVDRAEVPVAYGADDLPVLLEQINRARVRPEADHVLHSVMQQPNRL
ncbi:MAG: DNA primase [Ideonella sp.]|nr:DNA primase [Ideonella sp.]MCC7457549.1 DNA primase [Nitrospira sp.]